MEIYLQKTGVSLLIIYGILIESGADVKNVQTRLGHTNIETTLQAYVHDTEKMPERSVDLFEKITQVKTS